MQTQLPSRGAAAAFPRTVLPQSLDAPVRVLIPPPPLQPLGLVFYLSFLPSLRLAAYIRASGEAEQNWPGGSPAQREGGSPAGRRPEVTEPSRPRLRGWGRVHAQMSPGGHCWVASGPLLGGHFWVHNSTFPEQSGHKRSLRLQLVQSSGVSWRGDSWRRASFLSCAFLSQQSWWFWGIWAPVGWGLGWGSGLRPDTG